MTAREELSKVRKQIREQGGKTETPFTSAITTNPFTTLGERKIEQGSTGSARLRRMPFHIIEGVGAANDTHGNFDQITHTSYADAGTTIGTFYTKILPSDYIRGGFPSINILWMNDGTTGDVTWFIRVVAFKPEDTDDTLCLASTEFVTVPGVASTMALHSVDLTFLPETDSFIHVLIQRSGAAGSDTNSSESQLYSTYLEYLAHS